MKHLDLFSGVAAFALSAFQVWGDKHEIVCFVEPNKQCQSILKRHFPKIPIEDYIEEFVKKDWWIPLASGGLVCGGDPCPIRSKAKSIHGTKHPDLSGYFLAVVASCRPEWVLRENVPASDDICFSTALEVLGYRTVIVSTNAYSHTGQNRTRDIIVGCAEEAKMCQFRELYQQKSGQGVDSSKYKKAEGYPCLTTHAKRYDARDGYIYDGDGRLRVADSDERTALAGLPVGWLDGMSKTAVARMTGNAVCPSVVVPIMQAIKEIEES